MMPELTSSSTAPPTPRRKRRLLRFSLWFTGILVLLWIVAFLHATWSLNQAITELKRRGEPTTFAEAVAANERNAPTENGADLIRQALLENERLGRPGDAVSAMRGLSLNPIPSADVASAVQSLQQSESVVTLLEKAVTLPPGPFTRTLRQSDFTAGLRFPMSQDVRSLARHLYFDVKVSAAAGDARRAFRRLKTLYLFSEQLAGESFLLPQLVRIAHIGLSNGAAQFAVQHVEFNRQELDELIALTVRVERNLKLAPALVNQRAMDASILLDPKSLNEELKIDIQSRPRTSSPSDSALLFCEWRWAELISTSVGAPARRRAAEETLCIPNEVLELVDTPPPWSKEANRLFDAWQSKLNLNRVGLNPRPDSSISVAYYAALRSRRCLAMTQLALRIRRYDLILRRLPDRLEDLCDASMPELPTKWFEGKPFVYSKEGRAVIIQASVAPEIGLANDQQREAWGILLKLAFSRSKVKTK